MHEIGIAQSIIEAVLEVAREHQANKVLEVNVEVGELMSLKPEQLCTAFEIVSKGTIVEKARLNVKIVPCKIRCRTCGFKGKAPRSGIEEHQHNLIHLRKVVCPKCGGANTEAISGAECFVRDIKLQR